MIQDGSKDSTKFDTHTHIYLIIYIIYVYYLYILNIIVYFNIYDILIYVDIIYSYIKYKNKIYMNI